jgi:AAA+ ATPase superfamily predicted ATPase
MFLQRENELALLNTSFNKANSSIEFLYGAKNCGKTALLHNYSKEKDKLYFSNYEMMPTQFFTQMANTISNHFYGTDNTNSFHNFSEILKFLEKQIIEKKLVLIFDDFQNILKVEKSALSELFTFWKKSLKNKNIQIIISSSLLFQEVFEKDIKRHSSNILHLEYLDFISIKEFFPDMNRLDQLYVYSLLGTTPSNLKFYNSKIDFTENIYNLFLSPNAYLFDYGIKVLKNEKSDIGSYSSILNSISNGNTKIGDIANTLGVKSTYLTRYLQKLVEMMIIKKTVPVGEDKKTSKFGRYEILDSALKFWFSYIYPNSTALQLNEIKNVSKLIQDEFIRKTVFQSYKKCIIEMIKSRKKNILGYEPLYMGSWWDNHLNTIDLVAYDRKTVTFIQILWEDKDMAKISYGKLKLSSEKFKTSLEKKFVIVTKNTFFNM